MRFPAAGLLVLGLLPTSRAADPAIEAFLKKEIIGPRTTLTETQEFVDTRIPRLTPPATAAEWDKEKERIREKVRTDVIFRGEAAKWRDAKTKVETLETIKGGEGYTLKKIRYEILPGFWIPAILYEPENLSGKVPLSLAVNGHDRNGKAADYKQIRCINMAKRGMIVLNVEWLGMGQLAVPGNGHGAMNQLNLCGSSGLAPFFLSMTRGLDILLAHPNADPKRVAVSGLSGGGWQTIFVSTLDPRVTLANPVAGYSSFRTRVQHFKDLGDSEQTPVDLATVCDYMHLTAMRAPNPTLLTFNGKDNCCFEAGYALPPLRDGALPLFKLYGAEDKLRTHVNQEPGDHNFGKDNREALYKMIGDFFYPGDKGYSATEIPCEKELKTKDELAVNLPADNLTLNTLAAALMKDLPREPALPKDKDGFRRWQSDHHDRLVKTLRYPKGEPDADAQMVEEDTKDGLTRRTWKLKMDKDWTIPVVEFTRGEPTGTSIVLHDDGRAAATDRIAELLGAGQRVLAIDVWYFGEARPNPKDWLWGLMYETVGKRVYALQARQVEAVAVWAGKKHQINIVAIGPRVSTVALLASALSNRIATVDVANPLGSLKEIIETNKVVQTAPEQFCFGLLEEFDIPQIAAMTASRPLTVRQPSERAKKELAGLKELYKALGVEHDPLK